VTQSSANGGSVCPTLAQSCNTQACPVVRNCAVSGWGACSKPCGGGVQTRTVTQSSANGGSGCPTLAQSCNTQACPVVQARAQALDRLSSDGTSTLHQGNCLRSTKGKFCIQSDGNLVMYNSAGVPKWASNTYRKGSGPYKLVMQSDGNLVVYGNGKPTWASSTWRKGTPPYIIAMQTDNNVVLYDKNGTPTWASGTYNA
jgi:hypothetical protein